MCVWGPYAQLVGVPTQILVTPNRGTCFLARRWDLPGPHPVLHREMGSLYLQAIPAAPGNSEVTLWTTWVSLECYLPGLQGMGGRSCLSSSPPPPQNLLWSLQVKSSTPGISQMGPGRRLPVGTCCVLGRQGQPG